MTPTPLSERTDQRDEILSALLEMTERRLEACDPSLMGSYAEHLVATAIDGEVLADAWGPVDVRCTRPGPLGEPTHIDIQVKAARLYRTFNHGIVNQVGFSTAARKSLASLQAKDIETSSRRAPVWVFALHTAIDYRVGWQFFVVPGAFLDTLNRSTISANTLIVHGLYLRSTAALPHLITSAFEAHRHGRTTSTSHMCPKCGARYAAFASVVAHQAANGHKVTVRDLLDYDPARQAHDDEGSPWLTI